MKISLKGRLLTLFLALCAVVSLNRSVFGDDDGAQWTTDYTSAAQQAKAQNKAILLDFTGSDWCRWCMKMKSETLDAPDFKTFAAQNLVLVEVDFPRFAQQSEEIKARTCNCAISIV